LTSVLLEEIFKQANDSQEKSKKIAKIVMKIPEYLNIDGDFEDYEFFVMRAMFSAKDVNVQDIKHVIEILCNQNICSEDSAVEMLGTLLSAYDDVEEFNAISDKLLLLVENLKHVLLKNARRLEIIRIGSVIYQKSKSTKASPATVRNSEEILRILDIQFDENVPNEEGIDESFLKFVRKVQSDAFYWETLVIRNVKRQSNFFIETAVRDSMYRRVLEYYAGCMAYFNQYSKALAKEIIAQCESKLCETYVKKSDENYPTRDRLGLGRFYAELVISGVVSVKRAKEMVKLLQRKEKSDGLLDGASRFIQFAVEGVSRGRTYS
jgi:hypothetical protein